jgi:hypothetical protein
VAAAVALHDLKEMKMMKISQQPEAVDRHATVASPKPVRSLNEAELDRVAAAGGMTGGVVGTNA